MVPEWCSGCKKLQGIKELQGDQGIYRLIYKLQFILIINTLVTVMVSLVLVGMVSLTL